MHAHSTASDGTLSPSELIAHCHLNGISVIALTDHDTLAGVVEAARAGLHWGVEVISGIELEIEYPGPGAFHLLGLGLRGSSAQLETLLRRIRQMRRRRNQQIAQQMRTAGILVQLDEVAAFAGGDILARPHFASFLVDRGVVRTPQEAFDRYLGNGKPFWQPKQAVTLAQAAAAIHSAGGKALIAHPMSLFLSLNSLARRVAEWQQQGLDGVEAYHPGARLTDCRKLEAMADTLGMLVSAGSDFHGPERRDRRLGHSAEGIPIDDRFAEGFARCPVNTSEELHVDTR